MHLSWDTLQFYHADLHYHAGTERPEHCTLHDFIAFAVATGRKIVGVTDHWGRFLGASRKPLNHYPGTLDGFRQFAAETTAAQEGFPDALLLFGPEMGLGHFRSGDLAVPLEWPEVTFFLAETGGWEGFPTQGEYFVQGIRDVASARDRFGKPGILAHPLRAKINDYVGKAGPGPRLPQHPPLPPLDSVPDPVADMERLFDLDIRALAEAARRYDVPIEVNESSFGRIVGMNHESFAERYILFYRTLLSESAPLILGSDQHNAESPAPTPFHVARLIGLKPRDMTFLRHWIGA